MSSVADILSRLSGVSLSESGQADPAVLLEALLAAATNAAKEALAAVVSPPPHILVRWNSHQIAFSRITLQRHNLLVCGSETNLEFLKSEETLRRSTMRSRVRSI